MRIRTVIGVVVLGVLLVAPGSARAQNRSGGWVGFGGGVGSAGLTCDDCDSTDRETGGVAYVNAGVTMSPKLLLGAEFNLWTKKYVDADFGGEAQVNFYNLLATATFYPSTSGFFVKGGAGVAFFDTDIKDSGLSLTLDMGKGLGVIGGAGIDVPMGRIVITPAVNYWYASTGDLKYEGEAFLTGMKHNVLAFTVGVKWP